MRELFSAQRQRPQRSSRRIGNLQEACIAQSQSLKLGESGLKGCTLNLSEILVYLDSGTELLRIFPDEFNRQGMSNMFSAPKLFSCALSPWHIAQPILYTRITKIDSAFSYTASP